MKTAADFWAFSKAGRELGEYHVGYEKVPEHSAKVEGPAKPTAAHYRVENMRFGKGKDRSVIHYNDHFTVRDIPLAAYEYVVNGKSAIEWVMERQSVTRRQGERHREGRERVGDRDRGGSALPAVALAAGDHGQPRDDADREGAAGARDEGVTARAPPLAGAA